MNYPIIDDHGFVFPDPAELPEVKHEWRLEETTQSDELIKQAEKIYKDKNPSKFIEVFDLLIKKSTEQMPLLDGEHNIIQGWRKKLSRQFSSETSTRGWNYHNKQFDNKHFQTMAEQGVTFGTSDIAPQVKKVLSKEIDLLLAREDSIIPIGSYDRAVPNIGDKYPVVHHMLNDEFRKQGILEAAYMYTGMKIQVKKVTLHISFSSDSHVTQQYRDVNQKSNTHPLTTNLHIDPKFNLLKGAFYLTEVTDKQGPIWFVKTSNRWKHNVFESVWGRGNAVGNYLQDELHRRSMFRLPKRLRLNYQFGRNLLDGTAEQKNITDKVTKLTTDKTGNFALFDPGFTMHTGGNVDKGMRINLQLQFK